MRKCWETKSKDRPTFAALVPALHTALHKQCPDRSLIPKPQSLEDEIEQPIPDKISSGSPQYNSGAKIEVTQPPKLVPRKKAQPPKLVPRMKGQKKPGQINAPAAVVCSHTLGRKSWLGIF